MASRTPSICDSCKRLDRPRGYVLKRTCEAFPEGIPWPIASGLSDHSESTGTDEGLTYLEDPRFHESLVAFYEWVNTDEAQASMAGILRAAGEEGLEFVDD